MAVCFVDIVGYTSRSKGLDEAELVSWLECFEDAATGLVVDHGGRIIKTIGDEVLFVADRAADAAEAALLMTERGADEDDDFPAVRAGLAYGDVVSRLGDVFGPTVNIASRLTSVARPGIGAGRRRRARGAGRGHAVRLPADAPDVGQGLLQAAAAGAAESRQMKTRPLSTGDTTTTERSESTSPMAARPNSGTAAVTLIGG